MLRKLYYDYYQSKDIKINFYNVDELSYGINFLNFYIVYVQKQIEEKSVWNTTKWEREKARCKLVLKLFQDVLHCVHMRNGEYFEFPPMV